MLPKWLPLIFADSPSRVLGWIFGQPERSYRLSELRRLTGLGSASLQKELNRLAAAGLVNVQAVGNLRCFQANPNSPVYAELMALTRKTLSTMLVVREALLGRKINPSCYSPQEFERRRAEPGSFVRRVLSQPVLTLIG